jgi:homoserine kinase type II
MAVYTDITDEELAGLLADYDLGQAISFKGVAEGVENSNFLLETDAGRYFLTVYEKRVRREDLPFFLELGDEQLDAGMKGRREHRAKSFNGI